MRDQNKETTPTNSSLFGFFNRVHRQLTRSSTPVISSYIQLPPSPPIHIDLTSVYENNGSQTQPFQTILPQIHPHRNLDDETDGVSLMFDVFSQQFPRRELDVEIIRREFAASNSEEANNWWNRSGRSQMESELAVPVESLNSK